ncbi:DHH family phosphoesterase [Lachnoanaerobaculum saburreum]|jgi:phosphoesterase recJ domain-containing protein|uniref:Cyclic-di-AMP phosphodiesterase n=1 Tax=Lachnoanaerobaculum saburreum DSM 3986 TaxID=887325 RepID=E6LPV1_9FIRM|nr:DHH family phosphoesterase [Lachnoanaerobaculum saburreum]EFU76199.1 DHHA1 domain protein [Lachnoanaerobaculum saburreum DSM 3986]RKW35913.1 MAG: DHH family phosphoesterase [Lachnospiraceae bacterium]
MKNKKNTKALLGKNIGYSLIVLVFLLVILLVAPGRGCGAIIFLLALSAIIYIVIWYIGLIKNLQNYMVEYSMASENTQNIFSQDLDIPYALMDKRGIIAWRNRAFNGLVQKDRLAKKDIHAMFKNITSSDIENISDKADFHDEYQGKKYRIRITRLYVDETFVYTVCLFDETDLIELRIQKEDSKLVVGLMYMDNYDEAMESVEEVRHSILEALIDRKINQYINGFNGIVKKLEKDKFFFIIKKENLDSAIEVRFDILEDVKSVNIGNEMSITLSIGIGYGSENLARNYELARMAMDMALGRGGDQAVVKTEDDIRYFGGKAQTVEKQTRVKARVKAHAFRELLENKDKVIIMGHKMLDMDAFGAAIGIWRIATHLNKKAYILMSDVNPSAKPMIEKFKAPEYPEDLFMSEERALNSLTNDSLVVVVDVNRPSITEGPSLLKKAKNIVVLDHHRQSNEIITNATLSYVETFASSACEMVSEIVQYISDDIKLKTLEADAMYAGIVIDTQNFNVQTGVRTFEAAAFLKRSGADVTRVRKMFREDAADYLAKAEAIHNAEIYEDYYAISECDSANTASPTLVCAQAANDLLNIKGIKASFVLTVYNNLIYISARSMDEVNVQTIMEKLGGGGHRSVAGAQIKEGSIEDAKNRVKQVLKELIERGEL